MSKRFTTFDSVDAEGRVRFRRSNTRTLQGKEETIGEHQSGWVIVPKGEEPIIGAVYPIRQYGEEKAIGYAERVQRENRLPEWLVTELDGKILSNGK